MKTQQHSTLLMSLLTIIPAIFTSVTYAENQTGYLCLDTTSAYDRNFKWYNTMGPLPLFAGDHYVFTGSRATDVYQDALSLEAVTAGRTFALTARINIYIENPSASDRDEFAIFVTDDTRVFTGDEFGFVIRQRSPAIYAYIQSPRIAEFFKEFRIEDLPGKTGKTYTLKAVYSEMGDKGLIRFFINDIVVLVTDYPKIYGENFYLVISSKKLSPENIDTSKNYMKVYSACIVNLPPQRVEDVATKSTTQQIALSEWTVTLILWAANTILIALLSVNLYLLKRRLKGTTLHRRSHSSIQ